MASHTGILDVSSMIVDLLRENMSPEIIKSPDTIGLCSPDEHGDFVLGIHLYDIKEDDDYINHDMINISAGRQKYPPTYLALHYMITAYSTADVKFKEAENHRMLGKVVQTLSDNPVLSTSIQIGARLDSVIRMMKIPAEEKHRLWNYQNVPLKTSLFYKVAPVEIESAKIRTVKRVTDAEITAVE